MPVMHLLCGVDIDCSQHYYVRIVSPQIVRSIFVSKYSERKIQVLVGFLHCAQYSDLDGDFR
jgi:hypothetical protein